MAFTRYLNAIIQAGALAAQVAAATTPALKEHATAIQGTAAAIQAVAAMWGHSVNPDGTPASVSYMKDPRP